VIKWMCVAPLRERLVAFWLLPLGLVWSACSSEDGAASSSGGAPATGGAGLGGTLLGGALGGGAAVGVGGAGSGGGSSGGVPSSGGERAAAQFPDDTSVEGIAAFLATESYKSWAHKPAPYPPGDLPFHGELMLAYFNDLAVTTHADAALHAMTVKELYDASGNQIGIAAALKTSIEDDRWTYYCMEDVPGTSCTNDSTADYPVYEVEEFYAGCALCHGDAIISSLP
jgi:hypothetical protein